MKPMIGRIDALKEAFIAGIDEGASALTRMTGSDVRVQDTCLKTIPSSTLKHEKSELSDEPISSVQLAFKGDLSGVAELVMPFSSASKIATILAHDISGVAGTDSIRAGTMREVGNILLNAVMGTVGNIYPMKFVYSLPFYTEGDLSSLLSLDAASPDGSVLLTYTHFVIDDLDVNGTIMVYFDPRETEKLLKTIGAHTEVAAT